MATGQASSVYGMGLGRPIRTPYSQQVKSAYGQATQDVIARKKAEQEKQAQQFDQKVATDQLSLLRGQNELAAENAKRAMGMNIGTLGMNIAGKAAGNNDLRVLNDGKGMFSSALPSGGINLGSLAGSGLAGYGAYQAMGGGGKGLAAGIGAGLLTDAVSGGGLTSSLMGAATKIPGIGDALGGIGDFLGGLF